MKGLKIRCVRSGNEGYALLLVMGLALVGTIIMAGVLDWCNTNSSVTARNNEYFTTGYAAEAMTEKLLIAISSDFQNYGEGLVYSKLGTYSAMVPTSTEAPYWSNYEFADPQGVLNRAKLIRMTPTNWITLGPPYQGLRAMAATYQILATAKNLTSRFGIPVGVGQEINLGTIPIFQFAIFYEDDLEINPGATMNVSGLVHGNHSIYLQPSGVTLTFSQDVSCSGDIILNRKPGDPVSRSAGSLGFQGFHYGQVSPLNLPVGTNTTSTSGNVSDNVHAILDIPPAGESATSNAGTNRYYNKADLILVISNNTVIAKSGVKLGSETNIPASQWALFLNTNDSFFNKRENMTVQGTSLDVNQLRLWSQTNTTLRPLLGGDVATVYIADMRNTSNSVLVTNYVIWTNSTVITSTAPSVALSYPASGTYQGSVDNTTYATNSTAKPSSPPAINIITNTTPTTTTSYPVSGTYIPPVSTNTQLTSNNTFPAAGTYVGSVTTNKNTPRYTFYQIKSYTYPKISSYSYSLPAYAFNKITSIVTNYTYTTNTFFTSNYVSFAESGVTLVNGKTLPSRGLTVASPNPVYVQGHYNVSRDGVTFTTGSADTANTRPASIVADAITILSSAWNDVNSSNSISSRVAADTTVNAAFLSGIVPTSPGIYSGGVENFPRFLENWSGKVFTYNGSMVVMFNSRIAAASWGGNDVYSPPNRNWAFDRNFMDSTKLPPSTPQVISITRGRWSLLAPTATSL